MNRDFTQLASAVRKLLANVRTDPKMDGSLSNPGITDRKAFCESMREVIALLESAPPCECDESPCDCDHDPSEEHKDNCSFWRQTYTLAPLGARP